MGLFHTYSPQPFLTLLYPREWKIFIPMHSNNLRLGFLLNPHFILYIHKPKWYCLMPYSKGIHFFHSMYHTHSFILLTFGLTFFWAKFFGLFSLNWMVVQYQLCKQGRRGLEEFIKEKRVRLVEGGGRLWGFFWGNRKYLPSESRLQAPQERWKIRRNPSSAFLSKGGFFFALFLEETDPRKVIKERLLRPQLSARKSDEWKNLLHSSNNFCEKLLFWARWLGYLPIDWL